MCRFCSAHLTETFELKRNVTDWEITMQDIRSKRKSSMTLALKYRKVCFSLTPSGMTVREHNWMMNEKYANMVTTLNE